MYYNNAIADYITIYSYDSTVNSLRVGYTLQSSLFPLLFVESKQQIQDEKLSRHNESFHFNSKFKNIIMKTILKDKF